MELRNKISEIHALLRHEHFNLITKENPDLVYCDRVIYHTTYLSIAQLDFLVKTCKQKSLSLLITSTAPNEKILGIFIRITK